MPGKMRGMKARAAASRRVAAALAARGVRAVGCLSLMGGAELRIKCRKVVRFDVVTRSESDEEGSEMAEAKIGWLARSAGLMKVASDR